MRNSYVHGTYNAICDSCGLKFKAFQLSRRWDGAYVCKEDYETRHPQELLRVRDTNRPPPWTRPDTDARPVVEPFIAPVV